MSRRSIRFAILALLLRTLSAQTQPDVAEILKQVAATYKAATQYEYVFDGTYHDEQTGKDAVFHGTYAFKAQDRYRIQRAIPDVIAGDSGFREGVIICDGTVVWFYLPKLDRYGSFSIRTLNEPGRAIWQTSDRNPRIAS